MLASNMFWPTVFGIVAFGEPVEFLNSSTLLVLRPFF
jgi:hypothetical protein